MTPQKSEMMPDTHTFLHAPGVTEGGEEWGSLPQTPSLKLKKKKKETILKV